MINTTKDADGGVNFEVEGWVMIDAGGNVAQVGEGILSIHLDFGAALGVAKMNNCKIVRVSVRTPSLEERGM